MFDLENKSPEELEKIIADAQSQLQQKEKSFRKEKIAQIKELAAAIDATVEIHFDEQGKSRRGGRMGKVAAKYRNPANPSETWTGRGVTPKWMQELIAAGHSKEKFVISNQ